MTNASKTLWINPIHRMRNVLAWLFIALPLVSAEIRYATVWTRCEGTGGSVDGTPFANISHQQSISLPTYTKNVSVDCEINGSSPVNFMLKSLDTSFMFSAVEGNAKYFLYMNSGLKCNPWTGMKFEERYSLTIYSSDNKPYTVEFQLTSVNTRPKCNDFSVYVRSENCPGGFNNTGLPTAISALSTDYGRCTASYNDGNYCGPRYNWWTDNLVANGQGQVAWNNYWSFPIENANNNGVWTNLGQHQEKKEEKREEKGGKRSEKRR